MFVLRRKEAEWYHLPKNSYITQKKVVEKFHQQVRKKEK